MRLGACVKGGRRCDSLGLSSLLKGKKKKKKGSETKQKENAPTITPAKSLSPDPEIAAASGRGLFAKISLGR